MSWIKEAQDKFTGALAGWMSGARAISQEIEQSEENAIRAQEASAGMAELELAEEDINWRDLMAPEGRWEFTRRALRLIVARSRLMYLVNPLIHRAVTVQELYVWGGGVEIKAEDKVVDEVIQDFFTDQKNQRVIGNSWPQRERDQRVEGNTFFVFFRNRVNGTARVRLLPFDQIQEIIYNPEDSSEPRFYLRGPYTSHFADQIFGENTEEVPKILYPDIDYNPIAKPAYSDDGTRIEWGACVLHVSTGGLSRMRFGLPELYSALNWAVAYKRILENFATVLAAYARLAMQVSGLGKKKAAAAKSKLGTTITAGQYTERNPPNTTAGWAIMQGGAEVKPIKTAGSTTGPDEAHALRAMVAAGTDTPEHFFGDSDIGNFATSSTLDRPTELKMVGRQRMWMLIILRMCQLLIEWATVAPQGKLRRAGFETANVDDPFDGTQLVMITPPDGGSLHVAVEFPNILERDVTDRVRSVVMAATLGGSPAEGVIPDRRLLFKLLMEALSQKDAEAMVEKYYPQPVLQGFKDPADQAKNDELAAQGKKELGDAALQQAAAAKAAAAKPTPKPSGAPLKGASNK